MTHRSDSRTYVALTYWERFRYRLPWAVALCGAIGLVHGLTAGRSGAAVITYTLSAVATQVFFLAPLLTLLLAAFPSKRPTTESDRPGLG